jgi:hypothetical protein
VRPTIAMIPKKTKRKHRKQHTWISNEEVSVKVNKRGKDVELQYLFVLEW